MGTARRNERFFNPVIIGLICSLPLHAQTGLPSKAEIIAKIKLANDYWISTHANPGDAHWAIACYYPGNNAAYQATGDKKYLDYSVKWATQNNWAIYNKAYKTISAVNHTCGQTYIELYQIDPVPSRIANIKSTMDMMSAAGASLPQNCVDETFMSGPVYAKLTALLDDPKYENKYFSAWTNAKVNRGFYDAEAHLWYRDGAYKYPGFKTPNGLKCFWSRGNGWAVGALTRILDVLPETNVHRQAYLTTFKDMMAALVPLQRSDGFWNMSLVDPNDYPGPEESGTAFFVYGMAWGINKGILDRATYLPVVLKGWNGLATISLQSNGSVGYVQSVGQEPVPNVRAGSTHWYGVGSFLLAGSEMVKLAGGTGVIESRLSAHARHPVFSARAIGKELHVEYHVPVIGGGTSLSIATPAGRVLFSRRISSSRGESVFSLDGAGTYLVNLRSTTGKESVPVRVIR